MTDTPQKNQNLVIALIVVLALAAGYYFYEQNNKETVLDVNIGGKQIKAEIER
ncbi:MAG TPA: hypothetical protein PKX38_06450 [Alphaproteobacteria bacterium]|jgi:Tfp pilus assembly protein PilO|nr:hypothetical protein [Micavibrio sp.]MBK9562718.1 hypothetical protein [Micavibrio sp.]MBP7721532.1 hypothetical protein [Alphaproteobacteria bacterium]HQX27560.1 hypothetical protein [Alphaproteobacteria bacterium]